MTEHADNAAPSSAPAIKGYWSLVWLQFRRNRVAFYSAWVVVALMWLAAWGPLLANGMPIRWTVLDLKTGAPVTTYPLFRWLTAPTDGLSVDYLFNYVFFLSLAFPAVFLIARLLRHRNEEAPPDTLQAARRRSWRRLLLSAGAFLLAGLPFLDPGRVVLTDGTKGNWELFRRFRLDESDYAMAHFDLNQAKGEGSTFTLIPFGPNATSSEIRHPPGRYIRRQGLNWRIMTRDVVRQPHLPNIEDVCFDATFEACTGEEVRFNGTGGSARIPIVNAHATSGGQRYKDVPARVVCTDARVRAKLQTLSPGSSVWVYGQHLPEMNANGELTEVKVVLMDVAQQDELQHRFWHWMGTDKDGRDVLSRMIHGARISMSVGFISVGIATLLGILIGGLAGYYRGWVDIAISRFMELVICFPTFFLIITIIAFVKDRSIFHVMLIMGLTGWTGVARLVRGEFLKLVQQDFVSSARALGCSRSRIMFRHILPNAMGPVLVSVAFGVAGAVLTESGLAFLGFGAPTPTPTWGELIKQGHAYVFEGAWWLFAFPGFLIFLTVTVYNLAGDGLRDAMDPRLRK